MKFCMEIGREEKHLIEFSFNQLMGQLVIKVNHHEIKRHTRLFNEPLKEIHSLEVGDSERMKVRIEKERKALFGQRYRVFLNERLYQCYGGS